MKLRYIEISNFKGIEEFSHSFVDELTQEVYPITALFGDNGSGKTSVLQAISLLISMATWKTEDPDHFKWHGFIADESEARAKRTYEPIWSWMTKKSKQLKTYLISGKTTNLRWKKAELWSDQVIAR